MGVAHRYALQAFQAWDLLRTAWVAGVIPNKMIDLVPNK